MLVTVCLGEGGEVNKENEGVGEKGSKVNSSMMFGKWLEKRRSCKKINI